MKAKKLIALLLTMMMIVGTIPAFSLPAFAEGETEITTPTDNATYTEVADYDALITALEAKQNVKLTADVTFPTTAPDAAIAELWDGAVIDGNGFGFKGVTLTRGMFTVADGAHFTIKNLNIEATLTPDANYTTEAGTTVNRFGVIADMISNISFDIENVNLTVTALSKITGNNGISGFFGDIALTSNTTSTFTNCTVNGSVAQTVTADTNHWANGFVTFVDDQTATLKITDCTNNASVSGGALVSGFVGQTSSNFEFKNCVNNGAINGYNRATAGFISYNQYGTISMIGCKNYGTVTDVKSDSTYDGAAGIAGWLRDNPSVTLENCTNEASGTITAVGQNTSGIVAYISAKAIASNVNISNCENKGNINATGGYVGGIVGYILTDEGGTQNAKLSSCKNYGTITATGNSVGGVVGTMQVKGTAPAVGGVELKYCSNFGAVTSTGQNVGGMAGYHDAINANITYDGCLNMGSLTGSNNTGGMLGLHYTVETNTSDFVLTNCISIADVKVTGKRVGAMIGNGKAESTTSTFAFANNVSIGTITGSAGSNIGSANKAPACTIYSEITDDVAEALNNYGMGYFYNNNGTIKLDEDVPQLYGAQTTYKAGNTQMDVRFVAVLKTDKLNNYENVGFKITPVIEGAGTVDLNCSTVFTSLLGQGSESVIQYTAGDLGGSYIFALSVTGVPTTVSFKVTPYANQKTGSPKVGVTWLYEYVDGVLTGAPIYE